jgi:hypothetical protein
VHKKYGQDSFTAVNEKGDIFTKIFLKIAIIGGFMAAAMSWLMGFD